MEEQNTKKQLLKELDLLQLVAKLLLRWKLILKVSTCFMLFGVVIAFSTIKTYTSEVMIAPETTNTSMLNGGTASLITSIGLDFGNMGGEDAIYPLLYPDIIQSLPFLSSLFDVKVKSLDGTVDTTYFHYRSRLRKVSWIEVVKSTPKRVVTWLGNTLFPEEGVREPSVFNPYNLSKNQMKMIESLNSSIGVFVDKKTNVISLSFTERDPLIAAIMVDTIKNRLQQRITEYRTQKAIGDCKYIENLYNEAKFEYEQAQERYADFVDSNRNIKQERLRVELERLEEDKSLKNMLYSQWAQQLLLAKAKIQENTPAFTTLKPAAIPALPSSMRKLMVILLYTLFGVVSSVTYILFKDSVLNICRKLKTFNK